MADAYGTLVFNFSENADIDKESIVSVLNEFEWAADGGEWEIDDREDVYYSDGSAQYPTVCVSYKTDDDDELEDDFSGDDEVVPLSTLRDEFLPFIKEGWIQVACIANEGQRYVYMEQLKIFANGKAVFEKRFIKNGSKSYEILEEI